MVWHRARQVETGAPKAEAVATQAVARATADHGKLKIFSSYARADASDFARELLGGLKLTGFEPKLDIHDIAKGEDWEARLGGLIADADTVIFVVSPRAVASARCTWEVKRTLALSKRLLPVVWLDVAEADVPAELKALNYTHFSKGRSFTEALAELATALRQDLPWIREHTRLGDLAARWAVGEPDSLLLRGDQLQAAHGWVKRRKSDAPEITEAQLSLLNASAEAEAARTSKEKQQLEDMAAAQSATATALSRSKWALHFVACVLVFAGLTFAQIVLQAQEIVRRDLLVFSSLAAKAYGEQEYDRGMRYALQAYPPRGDLPWSSFSTALEGKLAGGSLMSRLQLRLNGHTGPVSRASFSPDGRHIVTASFDNLARIWDAESGKEIAFLKGHSGGVNAASFSPDGKRVVTASDDQTAQIWDAESGKDIALLKGHTGWVRAASFSPDGKRVVTASSDQTAPVWDAETGKETAVRLASYSVSALRRIPHASRNG